MGERAGSRFRWWPCLLLAHALLVTRVGTFYGVLDASSALMRDGLLCGGGVAGGWLLWTSPSLRRALGSRLMAALLFCLVLVAVTPIHASYPRFSLPGLLGVSGGIGWGIVAFFGLAGRPGRLRWTSRYLALCGLVLSIWSYLEFKAGVTVRPSLPLGHHNFLAGILLLSLGPSLALCFGSSRTVDRLLGGVSAILVAMTLAGTSSLSAVIGLIFACVATLWWMGSRRWIDHIRRGGRRPWSIAVTVAIGIVLTLTVIPGGPRVLSRSGAILQGGGDLSLRNRVDYASGALQATWEDSPWVGFGAGATAPLFALHRVQRHEAEETGKIVTQLHSTPVHLLYEWGLFGLLGICLLLAACVENIRRTNRGDGPQVVPFHLRIGAVAGLVAYGVCSLGDFQLHIAAIGASLALVFALAASRSGMEGEEDPRGLGQWTGLALFVTAVSATGALLGPHRAHHAWDQALNAKEIADVDSAIEATRRAFHLDPALGFYQGMLADLLEDRGDETALEEACRLRVDAARRVPTVSLVAAAAGQALLADGRSSEARPHLELAAALDAASPLPWYYLGEAARDLGDREHSISHHERALRLDSRLIGATVYRTPEFDEVRTELAARLRLSLRSRLQLVDLPGLRERSADAVMKTDVDAGRWRSRSAFVFRRRAWPTDVLPVAVTLGGVLGQMGRRLAIVENRFPGALGMPPGPELPARAADILRGENWNSAMEMTPGAR